MNKQPVSSKEMPRRRQRRSRRRPQRGTMPSQFNPSPWIRTVIRMELINLTLANLRISLANQLYLGAVPGGTLPPVDLRLHSIEVFPNQSVPADTTPGSPSASAFNFYSAVIFDLTKPTSNISTGSVLRYVARDQDLTRQGAMRLTWPAWQRNIMFSSDAASTLYFASINNNQARVYVHAWWRPHLTAVTSLQVDNEDSEDLYESD